MNFKEAKEFVRGQYLAIRRMNNYIDDSRLEKAYENAKDDPKAMEEFEQLIRNFRYEGLRYWMVEHLERDLTELTVLELRALARPYVIPQIDRLRKDILIQEIIRERNKRKPNSCRHCGATYSNEETHACSGSRAETLRENSGEARQEVEDPPTSDS